MRGFTIVCLIAISFGAQADGAPTAGALDCDDSLRQATEAAANCDVEGHLKAVNRALELDPANPAAHAERGEVLFEGRWIPVEYAQHLAREDERLVEYRRRRRDVGDGAREQRDLANWCRSQGLEFEARPHWLAALDADPEDRTALKALDAVWENGRLATTESVERDRRRAAEVAESEREWDRILQKVEGAYRADERLWERFDDVDVGLIRPVESRIAASEQEPPKNAARLGRVIELFLDAAKTASDPAFTASLCRIAVMPGDASLRSKAAAALRQRPRLDSIPILLEALIAPIDSEYRITRDRAGNVSYQHRLSRTGAERDQDHQRMRLANVSVGVFNPQGPGFTSFTTDASVYRSLVQARFEGLKKQIEFQDEATRTVAIVDAYNQMARSVNERTIAALVSLTDTQLGEEPTAWWDYWRRLSGYDLYSTNPVDQTYEYSRTDKTFFAAPTYVALPPPPPVQRCECFVAGTLVWTRSGSLPIEHVREGDFVLARDPEDGGLAFRAVVGRTVREPSPTVAITLADESITATEGHPFWVVGAGWRMARELREGDVLSTVGGPTRVDDTTPAEDQTAYNLIVEGAANYYVGESGVLVHDNTPRRPAVGLIVRR